jgi:uncharacterized protein
VQEAANPDLLDGEQGDVITFLSTPASHGGDVGSVQTIVTHAAMVFVAGGRAYKLKRAVKLPYLDFTSLEAREKFLRRELALNAPTAAGLYLDVQPVYRGDGGRLSFAPPGDIVDWCLVMRSFEQSQLLSNTADEGRFDVAWVAGLVRSIQSFHEAAPKSKTSDQVGMLGRVIDQLEAVFRESSGTLSMDSGMQHVQQLRNGLAIHGDRLTSRLQNGFVRRCHGDLHLGNVVVIDGKAIPFDALEFDESLATIDVLYDLAFLLMDLWRYDLKRAANLALNEYVSVEPHWSNLQALSLLPWFLSLRASIRAMVALQRGDSGGVEEGRSALREAQVLFGHARAFLAPVPAQLIAVGGLSGTGKTTVSSHLAPGVLPAPGAIHVRSDVERKRLFGVSPTTRLGAEAYRRDVTNQVYGVLCEKASAVLAAGHSVVVDAVFAEPAERQAIEACAKAHGAVFQGLWLQASSDTLVRRVDERRNDASDATVEIVEKQRSYDVGPVTWRVVSAEGRLDDTLVAARRCLVAGK